MFNIFISLTAFSLCYSFITSLWLLEGARVGLWNVPFIASPLLIKGDLVKNIVSSRPFHYSKELDPDMSFALYARHKVLYHISLLKNIVH